MQIAFWSSYLWMYWFIVATNLWSKINSTFTILFSRIHTCIIITFQPFIRINSIVTIHPVSRQNSTFTIHPVSQINSNCLISIVEGITVVFSSSFWLSDELCVFSSITIVDGIMCVFSSLFWSWVELCACLLVYTDCRWNCVHAL